jgi:hypothetical protein
VLKVQKRPRLRWAAFSFAGLMLLGAASAHAQDFPGVRQGGDGRLVYAPNAAGDRIIDFSHAGYRGGGTVIPTPAATLIAPRPEGDATEVVQTAIDRVSRMTPDAQGFRGVVQLERGVYRLNGRLRIEASGVILRGMGDGADGTVLRAEGTDRTAVVSLEGARGLTLGGEGLAIVAPARTGALTLTLASTTGLAVGRTVVVRRASTADWIAALGMDRFEGWHPDGRLDWTPGSRDVTWTRRILAIDGATITLDAPISMALGGADAPATMTPVSDNGRISGSGIENLSLLSVHDEDRPADEDHAWFGIALDRIEDGWVRDVSASGFVSYVINIGPEAARLTVQDVSATDPTGEIGGYRRRVFHEGGEQVLFNRCASTGGTHDFVLGHIAAGPNVFLDCRAEEARGDSGPMESWASGVLFDNVIVRGGPLRLANRGRDGQGAGWTAANSVLWNCEATVIQADQPPGAYNLAVGCKGFNTGEGIVGAAPAEPGRDIGRGEAVPLRSLYIAQLGERLGQGALAALTPGVYPVPAPGTPRVTEADVADWRRANAPPPAAPPLRIENGRFMIGDAAAWTKSVGFSWYLGQMPAALAPASGVAITRFAPGRDGRGLTDRIPEVIAGLKPGEVFYHHYGLWYDRRRVDHNFYGSPDEPDGEVWGPLMELPWARSGRGRAWDGLSKYDLTRYNPWFFDRVSEFATEADRAGRVLYFNFYFQHWLLESRAHYVDFPWRPVNTIQATGLPNEVPAAAVFYDVSDPVRRDLHQRYIRHSLDVLKDRTNVVYGIDREYTGPLSFVEFWLDTTASWQTENGRKVLISLELPKAETDALLANPRYRPMIAAIGVHDWLYRPDGSLLATEGGLNRASREQITAFAMANRAEGEAVGDAVRRLWTPTPEMAYRAWREYADGYPGLVFLFPQDRFPELTRAIERDIPAADRARTRPDEALAGDHPKAWSRSGPHGETLVYSLDGAPVDLAASRSGRLRQTWVGGGTPIVVEPGPEPLTRLNPPDALQGKPWAVWLTPGDR